MAARKSPLDPANPQLAAVGCRWRIRVKRNVTHYYVRGTRGEDRDKVRPARSFRIDDPGDLERLTTALITWEKQAQKKTSTLCLATLDLDPEESLKASQQTWGWVLDLYKPLLAPGGKLAKQLGAFGVKRSLGV